MRFILTGANAGKTMKINHVQFNSGVGDWPGPLDKMGGLINYLATFNAYPTGSPELEAAMKRDKEKANGPSAIVRGQRGGPEGGLEANESSTGPTGGAGTTGSETAAQGSEAQGSGEESGRVAAGQQDAQTLKVIDAINSLSPEIDNNWTDEGLPSVDAIAEASKVITVTRKDIEAAVPGFNRAKALAAQAAAL